MAFADIFNKAKENAAQAKQFIQQHSNPVNPPKEERETFANDSGGRDEGGGGGGSNPVNPVGTIGQGGTSIKTGLVSTENNNDGSGSGVSENVAVGMKAQQEAVVQKQQKQEQARQQAEAQRQAAEAIQRQQAAAVVPQTAPAPNVNDAIAQADSTVSAIQDQLNIARNNNSVEDILRLTEDLLQAQRKRDELDAQARAVAGTVTTTSPLVGTPQVVDNEYAQPATVGASNPLANTFATSLRPNDTRSSAFVKNAGRVVRDEEEDEFWTGGNPLREAIDRVNSGNLRATDQTYGRPVNGVTQPTSVYDVNPTLRFSGGNPNPQPGITRDQFLEATSNLLSPIANFGVRSAEGSFPYHPNVVPVGTTPETTVPEPQTTTLYDLENGTVDTNYNPATDFQTSSNPTLADNPMAYWLSREYPEYTGGDWSPTKVNPEWTPANPVANPVNNQPTETDGTGTPKDSNSLVGNLLVDTIMATNPISNIADKVQNLFNTGRGNAERLSQFFRPQQRFAGLYGNLVNAYNNDLTDIPSSNPYAGVYGDTSDLDLAQALGEVAQDPNNPTMTELEQENALVTERNTTPKPPVNTSTNASSQYNDALNSARDAASKMGLVPGTLAYDNFIDDHVRAYGNPVAEARNEYGGSVVGAHWTPEEEQQFFNRVAAGIPPTVYDLENLEAPGYDELGNPNKTLQLILNNAGGQYYYESPDLKDENGNPYQMPLTKGQDGKFYVPRFDPNTGQTKYERYNGEVLERSRYTPNEILGLYTKPWAEGQGTTWGNPVTDLLTDPTLSEEDRAGLNAILATLERGGQNLPNDYSRELFPTQVFDGTEAQYERLAQLFIDRVPGIKELMDSGQVSDGDVVRYFLKSYGGGDGSNPLAGDSGSGKPQTLPASYGQGDKVVKAPYRKGGYSAAELEAMGNSPYKDYRGYDAYEGYYYNYNDGQWYPVDQDKANYYNRYGTYRGWDEGMRDYYNTFGTFSGYTPNWRNTGKKSSGGGRSYYRGGNSYSRNGSYSGSSYSSNYQPYSYSNSSSTPQYANQQRAMVTPNTTTQRSNRVYNIMKNWSF